MFAGPNGSGKSTLKSYLPKALLGVYLNPDEIEQEIRRQGFLDLTAQFCLGQNQTASGVNNASSLRWFLNTFDGIRHGADGVFRPQDRAWW